MTLTLELPPDVEGALSDEARRRGVTPERLALDALRRLYGPAPQALMAEDPTLALFARWDAEDATDDPEEIARRQRDGDELLASLRAHRLSLRQVTLPDDGDTDQDA